MSISRQTDKKAVVHIHSRVFSSVQFNRSFVSDSLQPHPNPRVHPNTRPSRRWCHPAISSSVVPFSSCPQSLLASESFPMSQLFSWGGQSTGVSASASFLPKKSQGWSPCSPRDSQESSPTPQFKSINSLLSFLHGPTLTSIHDCREPARDIPLGTKVMRKEARHTQRRDRASGVPPDILEHLPPKNQSAYFIALCSHLWLYWVLSPTTISLSLSKS